MASLWGWERFFEEMLTFLRSADRESGSANFAFCEYVVERLRIAVVSCSTLIDQIRSVANGLEEEEDTLQYYQEELSTIVNNLRGISREWSLRMDQYDEERESTSYRPHLLDAPTGGRPKFDISKEQLEYLRSMNFSWTQIAELMGVSVMTIYRRRREFGMLGVVSQTVSHGELKTILCQMRRDLPNIGETIAWGHIRALGIKVTRQKLRDAIHDTDPLSTALRWKGELARRRPYSVAGPNSLWHIGEEQVCMYHHAELKISAGQAELCAYLPNGQPFPKVVGQPYTVDPR